MDAGFLRSENLVMKVFQTFLMMYGLVGCDSKTAKEREIEERHRVFNEINQRFKPQEIVTAETPTVKTYKEINNDSLFRIICTKDSLFSEYLNERINFETTIELKEYLIANIEFLDKKKVALKASANASYKRIQEIIDVFNDARISIKTFSLETEVEK